MNPIVAIIERNLLNYIRNKARLFGSLFMSVFMLVMFSFLMKSSMSGLGQPMSYLLAGVIIMTAFQTGINHSSEILTDIAGGYMKEVMVAPISRSEISIGNIAAGALVATLQGAIMMILAIFLGLHVSILQFLLMLIVMLISAMTFSTIGLFLAIVSRNAPRLSNGQFHGHDAPDLCFRRIHPHDDNAWFPPAGGLSEPADLYNLHFPLYCLGCAQAEPDGTFRAGHGICHRRICDYANNGLGNHSFDWCLFLCSMYPQI